MEGNYKNKLIALLEGLETQHISKLMENGKIATFRRYGEAYVSATKSKIKELESKKDDLDWVDALQGIVCSEPNLNQAIEQLKEVAKSNGLKAVITFEAL